MSYCILSCCVWLLGLRGLFFSEGKLGGSGAGREGRWGGEVKGGETVVGIHCVKEESLSSIKTIEKTNV